MPAMALTDLGNMFGTMEFVKTCEMVGIKPVVGCEVYLAPRGIDNSTDHSNLSENPHQLVLLAKNYEGYKNLMKIVSKGYLRGYLKVPRVDLNIISNHKQGLIALSAGLNGEITNTIVKKGLTEAQQCVKKYLDIFGPSNFYLEVQNHQLPIERKIIDVSKKIAKNLKIGLVATNEVHYLNPDDAYANEILQAITNKATIDMKKGEGKGERKALLSHGFHYRSETEMIELFKDIPEAIENTILITDQCDLKFPQVHPHMPIVNVPMGMDENFYLKQECLEGLKEKGLSNEKTYLKRLNYELEVIKKMGFPAYFLIVADLIQNAKKNSILVGPGRGSAAGSLVSYSLQITDLDPIKYGLLFERFLNPDRINMPDIDIDFQDNRREEVIDYCRKKYGREKVCQIITYGKLKAKAVFKDVARVFGIDFETANKLSVLIGNAKKLEEAFTENLDFKEQIQSSPAFKEIYDQALKLEGLTRQTGIHAAGVIIADKKIDEYCPLASDEDNNIITQYEGKFLEDYCGLIKMDFLGLKTLTILDNTIKLIKKYRGQALKLENIPMNDSLTYDLLSQGRAIGVFQFESPGMRKYLKELKPTGLDDLTAMNAMYRPGPLSWIPVYIAKKHHKENRDIAFKSKEDEHNFLALEKLCHRNEILRSILAPTKLIPIYQEQIMEIGQKFAGFTLAKADVMRRAMGKKQLDILAKLKKEFLAGADKLFGFKKEADFLYEKIIMPFAGYGFNKSHAVSYALVAYQTAYLKANYPECFMAALLNAEIENTDKIKEYIEEVRLLGVNVIAPSINKSALSFTVKKEAILYGLGAIKGVATSAGGEIILKRKTNGVYVSFIDFLRRNNTGKVNKQNIKQLIKAGCFDEFELDIEQLLYSYPKLNERIEEENQIKIGGQISFFEQKKGRQDGNYEDILNAAQEVKSNHNLLKSHERDGLGFNIKHDPILKHYVELGHLSSFDLAKKESYPSGEATIAGGIISKRKHFSKKGDEMCFLFLSNGRGNLDVVVFPSLYKQLKKESKVTNEDPLEEGKLFIIKGKLQNNNRGVSFLADKIDPYDPKAFPFHKYKNLHVEFLPSSLFKTELEQLKELVYKRQGGGCKVFLHFNGEEGKTITIEAKELYVKPNASLQTELSKVAFIKKIWFD